MARSCWLCHFCAPSIILVSKHLASSWYSSLKFVRWDFSNIRRRESILMELWIRVFNSCTSETSHTGSLGRFQMRCTFLTRDRFRDCTANNIMFDPSEMYPQGFHPTQMDRSRNFKGRAKRYTRTQRPPRYYLIDFGLSRQYLSRRALDAPLRGGDKSAPEHRNVTRCNPFYTDIYYLGNLVRREFIKVGLAMRPTIIGYS